MLKYVLCFKYLTSAGSFWNELQGQQLKGFFVYLIGIYLLYRKVYFIWLGDYDLLIIRIFSCFMENIFFFVFILIWFKNNYYAEFSHS